MNTLTELQQAIGEVERLADELGCHSLISLHATAIPQDLANKPVGRELLTCHDDGRHSTQVSVKVTPSVSLIVAREATPEEITRLHKPVVVCNEAP